MRRRRLGLSVVLVTALLSAGTLAVASVPPRPLRSVATAVHALSLPVTTYWLAAVALLAVAERFASGDRHVDHGTVGRLAAVVFVGGLAVELSPLARLALGSADPAGIERLAERIAASVQRVLFPTGLFAATALAALRIRADRPDSRGLPLAPTEAVVSALGGGALAVVGRVFAAVAALSVFVELAARALISGIPYAALALVEAVVRAGGGTVQHAVIAVTLLALLVHGVRVRSLVPGVVGVWLALFLAATAVAFVGAGVSIGVVGLTATPIPAVEGSILGEWPAPDEWPLLLRSGTYLAVATGLLAIQESVTASGEPSAAARETGETSERP